MEVRAIFCMSHMLDFPGMLLTNSPTFFFSCLNTPIKTGIACDFCCYSLTLSASKYLYIESFSNFFFIIIIIIYLFIYCHHIYFNIEIGPLKTFANLFNCILVIGLINTSFSKHIKIYISCTTHLSDMK